MALSEFSFISPLFGHFIGKTAIRPFVPPQRRRVAGGHDRVADGRDLVVCMYYTEYKAGLASGGTGLLGKGRRG